VLLAALQPLMRAGGEVIAADNLPGPGSETLAATCRGLGWELRVADVDDVASFEGAVGPRTQAILVPSLSASGAIADLAALATLAKRAGVPLVVDNTWLTAALCRPVDFGADAVVYGDTRFLCGASTGTGFIVDGGRFNWLASKRYPAISERSAQAGGGVPLAEAIGNFAYATASRLTLTGFEAVDLGALVAGVETLPLRMARHAGNARAVAEYLAGHRHVAAVSHAGLPGDRHHRLAAKYCPQGAGALVAFIVEGGEDAAQALRQRLHLTAWGTVPRAAVTSLVAPQPGMAAPPGPLILWVGLEDAADIIADLDLALAS
jgi:O-acetylhomoserine (thiol)-lyase